ncbi:glutathione S-transferase N-terminal domain-containing protein [Caenimonas soli]|uniref:glutathione S-transferase N-terminal domain-containing protein n=1 Tax=Caenimonas soli TaxID=2735555 RepID=UPI00155360B5|nr:glutathione S-transferase C-terminal domain-containing protein [Caenimonas soli]NPC59085.1 thiol:disulfide oxidoreductase [Caenimonas soli]
MIDFHYVPTGNNLKIAIALEELGLAYRLVKYDMYAGTHLTPEFRKINPNSKLPAIVDSEPADAGAPMAVFESGAILLYLAEKTGKLLPAGWRSRQEARQWLVWQVAGLGPMMGQANHFVRYAPAGQDYAVERYLREASRLLAVLDRRLRQSDYLAGEYSIADIACYPWASGTRGIGIDVNEFSAVAAWVEGIRTRPAIERAAAAILEVADRAKYTQARPQLTPQEWSALFGDRLLAAAKAP